MIRAAFPDILRAVRAPILGISDGDLPKLQTAGQAEDLTEVLQFEITSYLSQLSPRHPSDEVSVELPVFLHTENDLERVADHAVNIVETADCKIDRKTVFSNSAEAVPGGLQRAAVEPKTIGGDR